MDQDTENTRKRRQFTLEEKLIIIKEIDSGEKKRDVAFKYGIAPSSISTFLKNRSKIELKSSKINVSLQRKRVRAPAHEDIDQAVYAWLQDHHSQNIPVNSQMMCEKAVEFASIFGHYDFRGSTGWLMRFRNRYGLSTKRSRGSDKDKKAERQKTVQEIEVQKIIANYKLKDIFNANEFCFFYNILPNEVAELKDNNYLDNCGKKPDYVTVLLCYNVTGTEKMKPLVIGKSKNITSTDMTHFSCDYHNDLFSSMTKELFIDWLMKFDLQMKEEKRKVVLLLNNKPSYSESVSLQNVKLVFFPQNNVSVLQPLEKNISHMFKVNYRRRLLRRVLINIRQNREKRIDLQQAIEIISGSWWSVKVNEIKISWQKMGLFYSLISFKDNETEKKNFKLNEDDNLWNNASSMIGVSEDVAFNNYVTVDDEVLMSAFLTDKDIVNIINEAKKEKEMDKITVPEASETTLPNRLLLSETLTLATKVQAFLEQQKNVPEIVMESMKVVTDYCITASLKLSSEQKKITENFRE